MKVVLDTNVIISAFATRGLCAEIFEVCLLEHTIILSDHILAEVAKALLKKIRVPLAIQQDILRYLKENAVVVKPEKLPKSVCRDKNDDGIIGTAIASGASYSITGDEDLLSLKIYRSITIITPRQFWHIARQSHQK